MTSQGKKARQRKKRQVKTRQGNVFDTIVGFTEAVDTVFERLTGKPLASWFNEFQQRPRGLPEGKTVVPSESEMTLADAYAILGLKPGCPFDKVTKNYRGLSMVFHPDRGGTVEAMRLLNLAYARIKKEGKE